MNDERGKGGQWILARAPFALKSLVAPRCEGMYNMSRFSRERAKGSVDGLEHRKDG